MKLTKTSWLVLIGGIFIIVFSGMGMAYSRQTDDQHRLQQELAQAELMLAKSAPDKLAAEKEELETKLAQSRTQLETLKKQLSPEVQSIESSDSIFDIAEKCGVEVTGLRSRPPKSEKIGPVNYSALWLWMRLEGEVHDIIRFVHMWTEEDATGTVKSVKIRVPEIAGAEVEEESETGGEGETGEGSSGETGEEEGGTEQEKPSAEIELILYTYQGG